MTDTATELDFEQYEFDPRYFIHTTKNNISSVGHVIAEAVSNSDEAISARCRLSKRPDRGAIVIRYSPDTHDLSITDDGIGMTAAQFGTRSASGAASRPDARRAFFHRGIREAFMAMGSSVVESIVEGPDGYRYTRSVFHPTEGLGFSTEDTEVTPAIRASTGITETGTRVTIPLRRLATAKPGQFTFPRLLEQFNTAFRCGQSYWIRTGK